VKSYDVVIAGGGPAGAGAAKALRDSGLTYCVIEKYTYPRKKLCAGGLTNKSIKVLKELDLSIADIRKRAFGEVTFAGKGIEKTVTLNDPLYMVDRTEFDRAMMKQSVADCDLYQGETVTELRKDENILMTDRDGYRFRYLIFADGVNGYSFRLIPDREFGFAVECDSPVTYDRTVVDFAATKDGYGWIFPKEGHTTVGLGGSGRHKDGYVSLLEEFCRRYGIPVERKDIRGYRLPMFSERVYNSDVIDGKIILAGDAGSFVDCITGEGICYALSTGMCAARSIIEAEKNGSKLSDAFFGMTRGTAAVLSRRIKQSKVLYSPLRSYVIKKGLTREDYLVRIRNAFG
jgi:geranylgeranyl reductase family protein